jgi:hypothetical protein
MNHVRILPNNRVRLNGKKQINAPYFIHPCMHMFLKSIRRCIPQAYLTIDVITFFSTIQDYHPFNPFKKY